MIKAWIIEVSHGYTCVNRYGAYSEEDPMDCLSDDIIMTLEEDLWDNYGWTETGLEHDRMEDPDDEEEYNEIYQDFKDNIDWSVEEDKYGEIDELEIIYDEREDVPEVEEEDD